MFPFGIYAVPEISSVGMTEAAARAAGLQFEVGVAQRGVQPPQAPGAEGGTAQAPPPAVPGDATSPDPADGTFAVSSIKIIGHKAV